MRPLTRVINGIWNGEELSEEWKTGIIVPIYQKGKKDKAENYREISLLDSGYKIYGEVMRRRLEEDLEDGDKLGDTRIGFPRGRGTTDAVYVLKNVVAREISTEKG